VLVVARSALSEHCLSLTAAGKVRYQLKTPWRNGATHVVFEPLDFLAKLAALVPRRRVNLERYHGVFALNNAHWAWVTKSGRGKVTSAKVDARTPSEHPVAMRWAQGLNACSASTSRPAQPAAGRCASNACIDAPAVIRVILAQLANKARPVHAALTIQPDVPLIPWARCPGRRSLCQASERIAMP
jgi:hypothetical protein